MSLYRGSLRRGLIRLFSEPRLSLPLMLTLGLTLAAVLTVLSIAQTLLFQPLPGVKQEQQLYQLDVRLQFNDEMNVSFLSDRRRFAHLQQRFAGLGDWAQVVNQDSQAEVEGQQYQVTLLNATSGATDVIGLPLLLGEGTSADNAKEGVWISASLWRAVFGERSNLQGETIRIGGRDWPVFGVLEDFTSMDIEGNSSLIREQVWRFAPLQESLLNNESLSLGTTQLNLLRAPGGQVPDNRQLEDWYLTYLDTQISEPRAREFILSKPHSVSVQSYRDFFVGDSGKLVSLLIVAMVSLLVMACLNLLNMFIAHYQGRSKEFSVQLCMGASTRRLRLLVFLENLPMFMLASVTGLLGAAWLIRVLPDLAGDSLPLLDKINLDSLSLLVAMLLVMLINLLFASVSLLHVQQQALTDNLNSSGKGTPAQQKQGLNRMLMVLQLTIACTLMTAAMTSVYKSYQDVYQYPGYEMVNAYEISLAYKDEAWQQSLHDFESYSGSELQQLRSALADRLRKLEPQAVVDVESLPLSQSLTMRAYPDPETGESRMYLPRQWGRGYLESFHIPLLAGADLTGPQNGSREVLVDLDYARQLEGVEYWQNLVGKEIKLGNDSDDIFRVAGIVGNTRPVLGGLLNSTPPVIYFADVNADANGSDQPRLQMVVLMPEGQTLTREQLVPILSDLDPRLGEIGLESMQQRWQTMTAESRLNMYVVLGMAVLTLALAAIGVSGLSQMNAAQKRYELAVRMATGARQNRLLVLLLKDATLMLSAGLGLGLFGSVLGYQYLTGLIDQAPAFNWPTSLLVNVILAVTMLLSVVLPGWRVIRADPMQVLREL